MTERRTYIHRGQVHHITIAADHIPEPGYTLQWAVRAGPSELGSIEHETYPTFEAAQQALRSLPTSIYWWAEIVDAGGNVVDHVSP